MLSPEAPKPSFPSSFASRPPSIPHAAPLTSQIEKPSFKPEKLPLLSEAIRSATDDFRPKYRSPQSENKSSSSGHKSSIDRTEMLQKLKSEIFKNLHKPPSEIFKPKRRTESPIKSEPDRKRSKSDQDGSISQSLTARPLIIPPRLPVIKPVEEPKPVEIEEPKEIFIPKTEIKVEPMETNEPVSDTRDRIRSLPEAPISKSQPESPKLTQMETDSDSDTEIILKSAKKIAKTKPESNNAKLARIINRRPLPTSKSREIEIFCSRKIFIRLQNPFFMTFYSIKSNIIFFYTNRFCTKNIIGFYLIFFPFS